MGQSFRRGWVLAVGAMLASASLVIGADRPASEILKELDTKKMPAFEPAKRGDQSYVQDFVKKRNEAIATRGELILELYKTAPDNDRVPALMAERWGSKPPYGSEGDALLKEIDDILAHTKNEKLKIEGTFFKARAQVFKSQEGGDGKLDLSSVDAFLQLAPKDPRAGQLIYMAASSARDEKAKTAMEERILKDFADSQFATMIKGSRRQREGIGKPFELEFTEAISGSTISMNSLKGKVVVLDFWATWCGPCVAEMPEMKKLYEKFHGQGVEFIGISLDQSKDQGGLDALKKFVKDKEIPWPQYYQGKGWQSEFSGSWGINSIPSMFVVDQDGKLVSVEARGKLEQLLPELLKKKTTSSAAGGQ